MRLLVKNPSSDAYSYCSGSVSLPAGATTEISPYDWFNIYSDNDFWKDVKLNNITVNDGVKDYNLEKAEEYLKLIISDFNYNNKDIDGALVVRQKAAKKGWAFWAVPIEFTTATVAGTLYCKNAAGTDVPGITCKVYDDQNAEITTEEGLIGAVKTVVDFEPAFDYEVIGGALRLKECPDQDVRLWIVGAPDIPAQYGGSKEFASGINLKFLSGDNKFEIDGRVTKYLIYNANTHQSKMRIILKHPAGLAINMQIIIHVYRL